MTSRSAVDYPILCLLFSVGLDLTSATAEPAPLIDLPSGAQVYLQEKLEDNVGDYGLTQRFRFVMPDLSKRVPSTEGSATDFIEEELPENGQPGLAAQSPEHQDIDTQSVDEGTDSSGDYLDDGSDSGMIDPAEFDFQPVITIPGAEEAADAGLGLTLSEDDGELLPAAPDALLKDPIHDDIVWICTNIALPEALKSAKRPEQIVISLADRQSEFGSYDPDVLQIFESFSVPADKDTCEWRPW